MSSSAPASRAAGDSVQVAVRVRPASLKEKCGVNFKSMVRCVGDNVLVFDPEETEDGRCVTTDNETRRRVGMKRVKNLRYAYDHIFDADVGTSVIFERTTRPLIDYVISGYSATVFAYGATGSGKTHTMLGSSASGPGVMPLAIEALFDGMAKAEANHAFALRLSYLEVYNECIRDLLAPPDAPAPSAGGLALRQDSRKGISVVGLTEHEPSAAAEVFEMLERGNERRAVSETAANAASSRSHAVLQISLQRSNKAAGVSDSYLLGKLSLVDLAGSERAAPSRAIVAPRSTRAPTSTARSSPSATASTPSRAASRTGPRTCPTATRS